MANFTVTTLSDEASDTGLSLREAIGLANTNATDDTITFASDLAGGTVFLTQGQLGIVRNLIIDGDIDNDGTADITISADSVAGADDATSRVMEITDGSNTTVSVTLDGLVIRDGRATFGAGISISQEEALTLINSALLDNDAGSFGGGIIGSEGSSITLINSTLAGNTAGSSGGGMIAGAAITLINSTVSDNSAGFNGGGIVSDFGSTLTLINSTMSGNTAGNDGGALAVSENITATLLNSTLSGNSAGRNGGGLIGFSHSSITLNNSTVSGNSAGDSGGGISGHDETTIVVTNSIVAGNAAADSGPDLHGGPFDAADLTFTGGNVFGSAPHNVSATGAPTVLIDGSSQADLETVFAAVGLNPHTGILSGVLADTGGPVETFAIAQGGVAHNAGDDTVLPADAQDLDHDGVTDEPLPFDARDLARVINRVVDIGAFEIQNSDPTVIFNDALTVSEGASGTIRQTALFFIDAEETDITYTITSLPGSGMLFLGGTALM